MLIEPGQDVTDLESRKKNEEVTPPTTQRNRTKTD
jgi:hypothetical protein